MPRKHREDWPARFHTFEIICTDCGTACSANKTTARYCSDTCRVHAYKKRKKLAQMDTKDFIAEGKDDSYNSLTVKRHLKGYVEIQIHEPPQKPLEQAPLSTRPQVNEKEEIFYAMVNKEGRIVSEIYSTLRPLKGKGKVKVWFGGSLVEVAIENLEEHFRWAHKRQKFREIYEQGLLSGQGDLY